MVDTARRRRRGGRDRYALADALDVRAPTLTPSPTPTAEPSPTPSPTPGPINTAFEGITTFRGNATRTYYGEGPVPRRPQILWRYPSSGGLCSSSSVADETKVWCGTGWTGQPHVIVGEDGAIEVRINAYDGAYHFLDGMTGEPVRPKLQTGDLAKGSATSDPGRLPPVLRGVARQLPAGDRARPTRADGAVGGELAHERAEPRVEQRLGRRAARDRRLPARGRRELVVLRDPAATATTTATASSPWIPKIVFTAPGFDDELLAALPDGDVSIENSVAFSDGVAYFANSGGLVQGWDVSRLLDGGNEGAARLPVLDGRRHGRVDRDRRRGLPVRGERAPALQRPGRARSVS